MDRMPNHHIALLAADRLMTGLPPEQHEAMNTILRKHNIDGNVSEAPTLGHIATTAMSLRNQRDPASAMAGDELLAFIDNLNRE